MPSKIVAPLTTGTLNGTTARLNQVPESIRMDIYVGNLPYSTTDNELSDMFGEYGSVTSAKIIIDRDSQRSKGFGFVSMPDDGEARQAIAGLDGNDMGGRSLKVNEARPRENRGGGGGGGGGRRY